MTGLRGDEICFDCTHLHFPCFADFFRKDWSQEPLSEFDIDPSKMPRIVFPFTVVGKTTTDFAAQRGAAESIPIVVGCGDAAASAFGSGIFDNDSMLDCANTASVLSSVVDSYVPGAIHKTMTLMRSPIDGLGLPLAYINGGLCIRWFRDALTDSPAMRYDALEQEAKSITPGSEMLLFLPHFSSRVLPNDPYQTGFFIGLDFKHTHGHLYRAIFESVVNEYRYYLAVLHDLYPENRFHTLVSTGGGANSPLFSQIKADVLGVNVETFRTGKAALIGSAIIAGYGTGLFSDYRAPIQRIHNRIVVKRASFATKARAATAYRSYADAFLAAIDKASDFCRANPFSLQGDT